MGLTEGHQAKTVWENPAEIVRALAPENPVMVFAPTILQARADLRLKEVQRPASTFTFQHLPLPLEMSQVVRFVRTRHNVDVLAVVEKTSFDDGTGLAETTVREVVS